MSESGSLEWRLDYSQTNGLAIGDVVSSGDFSAGGYLWRIICYPRGTKREGNTGRHLCIFLRLRQGTGLYTAMRAGLPTQGVWHQFVKRSDLESLYVDNGWVTIACKVTVVRDDPILVPPSDIGRHLGHLLDCNVGADVSFIVGSDRFLAHRAVLAARSPVSRAELFGSMAEATVASITLQDIDPAAFRIMLRFMYTDELPADDELGDSLADMMQHLLAAADRYALDRLKAMCALKLWENVTVDTVASVLASAETYNIPTLKNKCIDFFVVEENFKAAVFMDGFAMLLQKFPALVAELRRRVQIHD
ncbi:hypothetical protein ACP70R_000491 [Stipagrostis hirtigluma subsp. patula]